MESSLLQASKEGNVTTVNENFESGKQISTAKTFEYRNNSYDSIVS